MPHKLLSIIDQHVGFLKKIAEKSSRLSETILEIDEKVPVPHAIAMTDYFSCLQKHTHTHTHTNSKYLLHFLCCSKSTNYAKASKAAISRNSWKPML